MEDDIKGKASRWAELVWDILLLPVNKSSRERGEVIKEVAAAGYEAGYAEGYEVAKRQKEEE